MKLRLIALIYLIVISSCKTKDYREKFSYYFDLSEQLLFIESNIINYDNNEFTIDISFGHNTINLLKSDFKVSTDSVLIKTIRDTNSKKVVDTTFTIPKEKLLEEINYQKNNARNLTVLAGHYQYIQISRDNKTIHYPTTRVAEYLIEFLETGKNH